MANSLDDLLTFCIGEIAISGERGIAPKDISNFVNTFYTSSRHNAVSHDEERIPAFRRRSPVVDEPFLDRVWRWLTKHPDVFVGPNKEGNRLSYSEIQRHNLSHASRHINNQDNQPAVNKSSTILGGLGLDNTANPDLDDGKDLRVYVTEERMWLAVCGHPPDNAKVVPMEFTLLSIIAYRREKGVLQGDLVRLSGQDKRSVPKRTDSLRDKGYIEKRPVLAKGARTSLLILKKFAIEGRKTFDSLGKGKVSGVDAGETSNFYDIAVLIHRVFDILEHHTLITRSDLKQQLGLTKKVQWKMLGRLVRKFEAWGCVKRVMAASKHSVAMRWRYPCVKLLRQPTKQEIENYCKIGGGSSAKDDDPDSDGEGEEDEDAFLDARQESDTLHYSSLEEVERELPAWNPDRSLMNQVAEIVHAAGTSGITQTQLQYSLFGPFVARPLEFLLARLVESWTLAQPAHLRHLSIIRDTAMGKIAYFLHYSFYHFQKLVDNGTAFWEAVIVTDKGNAKTKETIKSLLAQSELDQFGFSVTMRPAGQYKNGRATLGETIKSVNAPSWHLTSLDPVVTTVQGQDQIGYRGPISKSAGPASDSGNKPVSSPRTTLPKTPLRRGSGGRFTPPKDGSESKSASRVFKEGRKPTGRPRKYERGTEQFWRLLGKRLLRSRGLDEKGIAVMKHPLVIQMIEDRPQDFDDTYLRAIDAGAPVPHYPIDLNRHWVEKTKQFMDRKENAVYIAPTITLSPEFTSNNRYKLMVIIKSARLGECSFSEMRTIASRKTPVVQFFTSSRAHTFRIPKIIPSNSIGGTLQWLMPSLSESIPQPPVPSLHGLPPPTKYFPSIAAPTITHQGGDDQAITKASASRHTKRTSAKSLAGPKVKRQRVAEDKTVVMPGPVLGVFESSVFKTPETSQASPWSPDTVTARSPSQPTRNVLSIALEAGCPNEHESSAQVVGGSPNEPNLIAGRSLRAAITPSAKKSQNLQESLGLRQEVITEEDSPFTRRPISSFPTEIGMEERNGTTYLNSPSRSFPGSMKMQRTKARKVTRKPSSLHSQAITTDIPSPVPARNKAHDQDANVPREDHRSPDSLHQRATNESRVNRGIPFDNPIVEGSFDQSEAGAQNQCGESEAVRSVPNLVGGLSDHNANHNEKVDDSDDTIDLGSDKFLLTPPRRNKSRSLARAPVPQSDENAVSESGSKIYSLAPDVQTQPLQDGLNTRRSESSVAIEPAPEASRKTTEQETTKEESTTIDRPEPSVQRTESIPEESVQSVPEKLPAVQHDQRKTSVPQSRKKRKLDVWEGSIGFFRRKIISDVIDKCGGIIPFANPLCYVYATAWKKSGRSTKPDKRTIRYAVKSLIDAGQAKQLKFVFKDSQGLVTTQAMLARPHVKVNDPIVRKLQKDIIEAYPRPYLPNGFDIDPNLRQNDFAPTGVYKHPDVDSRELVDTEHKPATIRKAEERKRKAGLRASLRGDQVSRPRPLRFKALVPIAPRPGRVERLERIGGPHRLVARKPDVDLPRTRPISSGTTASDVVPSRDPHTQALTAKQILNDRKRKELPHSLADVPDRRRKKVDHSRTENPAYSRFVWEVEKVERWENMKASLFDSDTPEDWRFINHHLLDPFQAAEQHGPLDFGAWSWFDDSGAEIIGREPPDIALLKQLSGAAPRLLELSAGRGHRRKVARRIFRDDEPMVDSTQPSRKRKYLGSLQDPRPGKISRTGRRVEKLQAATFDPNVLFPDGITKAARGPQVLKHMPEEMLYRLLVTFAVVRVLVGGVEKYIDWSIVNQIFPEETEQYLKDRWKTMRLKYRHVIQQYQDDFQELFLKAYENGELPQFDYDDVANNEWEAIVDWAMTVLEKPIKHEVEDLPASRATLDRYQRIEIEPPARPLRDCFGYNTNITLTHKEHAVSAISFAVPVVSLRENKQNIGVPSDCISPPVVQPIKPAKTALETVARSWALATVLTPGDQLSGTAANAKMSMLPNYNSCLGEAVQALLTARVLTNTIKAKMVNAASQLPGRTYDISQHFYNALSRKKVINRPMLRRALWYKLHVLDPSFSLTPPQKIKFDMDGAEDGDMVAVLNLVASGRIVIRPSPSREKGERIPANRYGLIDAYQTRHLDKAAFRFAVELEPSPRYEWIPGNPLTSQMPDQEGHVINKDAGSEKRLTEVYPVPRGGIDLPIPKLARTRSLSDNESSGSNLGITPARIPLYYSIHGQFLLGIWEMLVAGIAGVLASRPGISTMEIFNMLHPSVEMEDITMVLQWMHEVGAVQMRTGELGGSCWEVEEWWWCLCDFNIGVDGTGVQEA